MPSRATNHGPRATHLPVPVPKRDVHAVVPAEADSLAAWIRHYGTYEANANAGNTVRAKARDLALFMDFFAARLRSDDPDGWTKPVTMAFLRHLEEDLGRKPTTVNRVLATLRHCAGWIHRHRPFLAGNPCEGLSELEIDEPDWKGLSGVDVMRLKSAVEQLGALKGQANQMPERDQAVFLVLLHTGLRVSELLALNRDQYDGKSFANVKRKGKVRSRKVAIPTEARAALDRYLKQRDAELGAKGPLFCTRKGARLSRTQVDRTLKQIAAQASAKLPEEERVRFSAHVLRHTFLRKLARKKGVEFAMEAAGHCSSQYIWRYVKPSEDEKAEAVEGLF